MNSIPLQNASIVRITLSIKMPTAKTILGDAPYSPVVQDVRTKTFLEALSFAAGLLALLQSIHVMLFGKRLLRGMFGAWPSSLTMPEKNRNIACMGHRYQGSNFLDPFGLFGAYALRRQRRRMAGIYENVDPNVISC